MLVKLSIVFSRAQVKQRTLLYTARRTESLAHNDEFLYEALSSQLHKQSSIAATVFSQPITAGVDDCVTSNSVGKLHSGEVVYISVPLAR